MWGVMRQKVGTGGGSAALVFRPVTSTLRSYASAAGEMTVRDALNSALDEEMSADPKVCLIGEEVGEYQGAYIANL